MSVERWLTVRGVPLLREWEASTEVIPSVTVHPSVAGVVVKYTNMI
jgi:hypothetical protein